MGSTSFTNKVVGIFSDAQSVDNALNDLNANGFDRNNISILAKDYQDTTIGSIVTHSSAVAERTTVDKVESALRHTDDAILGRDILHNNVDNNPDRYSVLDRAEDAVRHTDDIIMGRDALNNNREVQNDVYNNRNVIDSSTQATDIANAHNVAEKDPKAMVKGATTGGALGLIAGLGVLLLPGIGPVLAAGPLAAAVTAAAGGAALGATAGTLLGILNDEGIPSDRADFYNRNFSKGNIIVMVHTDEGHSAKAREILVKHNPETIDTF